MNLHKKPLWLLSVMGFSILIGAFSVMQEVHAAASLSFFPQRIVLADKSRSAVLRLTNKGNKAGSFRISMVDLIYANDGSVKPATKLPARFPTARPYVRFSPSQVRLNPGESQNIRVLLKRANTIPVGELRVHVSMKQIPDAASFTNLAGKNEKIIKAKYAIGQAVAIPLIIRRGETSAKGAINAASRTPSGVKVVLGRAGTQSLYTNIEVYASKVANNNLIGTVKGVGVPVPNRQRAVSVNIKKPSRQPYFIVLRDHDSGQILAQKRI